MIDRLHALRHPTRFVTLAAIVLAFAAGGATAQSEIAGSPSQERSATSTGFDAPEMLPAQQALLAYNAGLRQLKRAEKAAEKAAEAGSEKKRQKLERRVVSAREKAVEEFVKAVQANPEFADAFTGLGTALAAQEKYQDALGAYNRSLALEPGNVEALAGRGAAFLGLGQVREAAATYTAIQPRDAERAGALMAAIKSWVEVHRSDPGDVDPQLVTALEQWIAQQESG